MGIGAGYTWTGTAGDAISGCTTADCTSPTGLGDLACDTGNSFSGTATVTACSMSSNEAVLSGCSDSCVVPSSLPTGYTWSAGAGTDVTGCTSADCSSPTIGDL